MRQSQGYSKLSEQGGVEASVDKGINSDQLPAEIAGFADWLRRTVL